MTVAQSYSKASRGKRLVFIGAIPLGVALGALTWAFAPHSPWVGWGLAVVLIVLIVIQGSCATRSLVLMGKRTRTSSAPKNIRHAGDDRG